MAAGRIGLGTRLSGLAIGIGAAVSCAGAALTAIGIITGGLPGLGLPEGTSLGLWAAVPGFLILGVGINTALRGMHMRATYLALSQIRALTPMRHTPAPAPRVMAQPTAPGVVRLPDEPQTQPRQPEEIRASRTNPIKGKPFQPHPIFMARPPK